MLTQLPDRQALSLAVIVAVDQIGSGPHPMNKGVFWLRTGRGELTAVCGDFCWSKAGLAAGAKALDVAANRAISKIEIMPDLAVILKPISIEVSLLSFCDV